MNATGASSNTETVLPVLDTKLSDAERQSFDDLVDGIYDVSAVDEHHFEVACENFCSRIEEEVMKFPVLARTIMKDLLNWSLLTTLCEKTEGWHPPAIHPAIQFLIEKNPHALTWQWGGEWNRSTPIHTIAKKHCVLMPWIAERFSWVFDHPVCQDNPPHLALVRNHVDGRCDASIVRRFYELYPRGLVQEDQLLEGGLPLHGCLRGWEECDVSLFKWMAHQYPDVLFYSYQDRLGLTPLHLACISIASSNPGENSLEICRFLASECPESVRVVDSAGLLPIHFLTERSNRPAVQKLLLTLLRQHPQSIDVSAGYRELYPTPRAVPFVARVYPLLEEERLLKEDVPYLTGLSDALQEATRKSEEGLEVSVAQIFQNWVALRKESFTVQRLEKLSESIMEACREYEDEDDSDGDESEEGWDWDDLDEGSESEEEEGFELERDG